MPDTDPDLRLSSLLQIAMRVEDMDRAVAFYRDTLGAAFLFRAGNLAFFDLNGVRLMLDIPEHPQFDHRGSILYFRVDDIDAAHATLRDRGVAFRAEPHIVNRTDTQELWMAFFDDTEGNTLAIAEERAVGG